jgi:predicted sulfurtransferase
MVEELERRRTTVYEVIVFDERMSMSESYESCESCESCQLHSSSAPTINVSGCPLG